MFTDQHLLPFPSPSFTSIFFIFYLYSFLRMVFEPYPCIWVTLEYDGRVNIRDEFNGAESSDEFGNDSKYGG